MGDISKDINSKFPNNRVKALINIKFTAGWLNSKENDYFKQYELSPQQFNILRILRGANEPLPVQTIKDRMIERAPNTTRLMDKLCAKQFIERVRCEHDRRVVYINISTTGLKLLSQIDADFGIDFVDKISEKEAELLSNLLDKIR